MSIAAAAVALKLHTEPLMATPPPPPSAPHHHHQHHQHHNNNSSSSSSSSNAPSVNNLHPTTSSSLVIQMYQWLLKVAHTVVLAIVFFVLHFVLKFVRWHIDSFWTWYSCHYWLPKAYRKAQDHHPVLLGVKHILCERYGTLTDEIVHVIEPMSDPQADAVSPDGLSYMTSKPLFTAPSAACPEFHANPSTKALVYVHGGGFCIANSTVLLHSMTLFARQGYTVFSVEYPRAPEHRFPVPVISLLRALMWLRQTKGIENVALFGDSAGANIACMGAALLSNKPLLQRFLRETDMESALSWRFPKIECLISLYGLLDKQSWMQRLPTLNFVENKIATLGIDYCVQTYCSTKGVFNNCLSLCDVMADVTHYPRSLFIAGTCDPLVNSTLLAVNSLRDKGFEVHAKLYEGRHGFFGFPPAWTFGAWKRNAEPAGKFMLQFLDGCRLTTASGSSSATSSSSTTTTTTIKKFECPADPHGLPLCCHHTQQQVQH